MKAVVQKWGNSNAIRLPKSMTDELGIKENDPVFIDLIGGQIVIRKTEPQSLRELFEGYMGDYEPTEWDTGKPVGHEVF